MKRWSLIILTFISTLLCALSAFLWLYSYHSDIIIRANHVPRADSDSCTTLAARWSDGQLWLSKSSYDFQWVFWWDMLKIGNGSENANVTRMLIRSGLFCHIGDASSPYLESLVSATRSTSALGVSWDVTDDTRFSIRTCILPAWFLPILFAARPSYRVYTTLRRRHRLRLGLCSNCGYDLRASPTQCPECSAKVPSSVFAATTRLDPRQTSNIPAR